MKRTRVVLVLVVVAALAAWATAALAGDLNPPATAAPGGVPVPTMRTLEDIAPSWDKTLSALGPLKADGVTRDSCNSPRFKCVMADRRAVLDRETGLVWEALATGLRPDWISAFNACATLTKGDRAGWRLPTIEELLSLYDPAGSVDIHGAPVGLPSGHPFFTTIGDFRETVWTSSYLPVDSTRAAAFDFSQPRDAYGQLNVLYRSRDSQGSAWCVRGGSRRIE